MDEWLPKIIFTNQDQVMTKAIEQMFLNMYHHLYLWQTPQMLFTLGQSKF